LKSSANASDADSAAKIAMVVFRAFMCVESVFLLSRRQQQNKTQNRRLKPLRRFAQQLQKAGAIDLVMKNCLTGVCFVRRDDRWHLQTPPATAAPFPFDSKRNWPMFLGF
jgi:hypothetical protein